MKIILSKLLFLLLVFVSLFIIIPFPVSAQQSLNQILGVSPALLNLSLTPGKTYSYEIRVSNLSNIPLPVKVSFEDFNSDNEEGKFTLSRTTQSPLIQWIKLDKKELLFAPKSSQIINLKVNLPEKIPFGGYYVTMFFEPFISAKPGSSQVVPKIGALLFANIGISPQNKIQAIIKDFSLGNTIYEQGPLNVDFRILNNSLFHFSAKPFFILKPIWGSSFNFPLEEKLVFPGKKRVWISSVPFYQIGFYSVQLDLSLGQGKQIHSSTIIVIFPWKIIGLWTILFIITVFLYKKRNNIKKAILSLLHNNG